MRQSARHLALPHVLPKVLAPLIVMVSVSLCQAILRDVLDPRLRNL